MTDQKVYIANPDKELGRLALSFVIKFVASKNKFCIGVEGSGSYFLSCKYTFLTMSHCRLLNTSCSFILHVIVSRCGS